MKNILFRTDSSSDIGIGHVMRDLVLASKYQDMHIIFATQHLNGNINAKIKSSGYKIEILQSNDIEEVIKLVIEYNIDLVVIDHYKIDYKYEKELKKTTNVKILSFDDTYQRHCCDILLNHNISANKNRYKGLVPKSCVLKCGSKYTLLRDEFQREKKKRIENIDGNITTIFVAIGGSDNSNINISILETLNNKNNNLKVNIVTTSANKNIAELIKYIKNKKWIQLHVNSNNIALLMKQSTFAIVTPSVTLHEIIFMEIPFIAIKTAENQLDMCKYLQEKKYNLLMNFSKKKLAEIVNTLIIKKDL